MPPNHRTKKQKRRRTRPAESITISLGFHSPMLIARFSEQLHNRQTIIRVTSILDYRRNEPSELLLSSLIGTILINMPGVTCIEAHTASLHIAHGKAYPNWNECIPLFEQACYDAGMKQVVWR